MEKTIVVFGLTEGQAELLAAALPDAYTIQSAETITDLLVADAVCGIIHADALSGGYLLLFEEARFRG